MISRLFRHASILLVCTLVLTMVGPTKTFAQEPQEPLSQDSTPIALPEALQQKMLDEPIVSCDITRVNDQPYGTVTLPLVKVQNADGTTIKYTLKETYQVSWNILTTTGTTSGPNNAAWSVSGEIQSISQSITNQIVTINGAGYFDVVQDFDLVLVEYWFTCGTIVDIFYQIEIDGNTSHNPSPNPVPSNDFVDFSNRTCEEIYYNPAYLMMSIVYPSVEQQYTVINTFTSSIELSLGVTGTSIKGKYAVTTTDETSLAYTVPASSTVSYYLRFFHQGRLYFKACTEQLGIFHTNMNGWEAVKGQWNITQINMGVLGTIDGISASRNGYYVSASRHDELFSLESQVVIKDSAAPDQREHAAGLVFRIPAVADPEVATGYAVVLTTEGPNGQPGIKLFKYDPLYTEIQFIPMDVAIGHIYHLKLEVTPMPDPRIKVSVNGNLKINVVDPEPRTAGYAGLLVHQEQAVFDHVTLTNQGSNPPIGGFITNLADPWVATPDTTTWVETNEGLTGTGWGNNFNISDTEVANGELNADISLKSPGYSSGQLIFRVQDKLNPAGGSYSVDLSTNNGGQIKLFKFPYQPLKIVDKPLTINQVYHLRVVFVGPYISVYLDNQLLITDHMDSSYVDGFVGLNVFDSSATFQNVQLTEVQINENFITNLAEPWVEHASGFQEMAQGLLLSAVGDGFYTSDTPTPDVFSFESDITLIGDSPGEQAAALVMYAQDKNNPLTNSLVVNINTSGGGEIKLFGFPYHQLDSCSMPIQKNVTYKLKIEKTNNADVTISLNGQHCLSHYLVSPRTGGYFGLNAFQTSAIFNNTIVTIP